ncbi:hypothetical protein [Photobacterium atrarenae]|uniref:SGNH hydrolase-type esterase domain-containing protein n=1 Tax=Photobacterium atrarenae TaxID=865757 RepID=A0ABY5GJX3_9GAMM|nr:hypothetical protein [Photobacterium atrarenae]UTV29004.1 hypothetical protein NNL38_07175 [Photobacterium atrarenae]
METNNVYQLAEVLKQNIDWLNVIMLGNDTQSINIGGVERPSISKEVSSRLAAFNAMVQGRRAYETFADLVASGAPPSDKLLAEVWSDGDNNGLYGWNGASWVRSDYDLYQQVRRLSDSQSNMWYQDLGPTLAVNEQNRSVIVRAIKDVKANNLVNPNQAHYLWILASNDSVYNDRFYIRDESGTNYRLDPEVRPQGWENGPVWVRLNTSTSFNQFIDVLIDYRELPTGLLWNGGSPALGFSNAWLHYSVETLGAVNKLDLMRGCLEPNLDLYKPTESYDRKWMKHFICHAFSLLQVKHRYRLVVFTVDDDTHGNRMTIKNDSDGLYETLPDSEPVQAGKYYQYECHGHDGVIRVLVDTDAIRAQGLPSLLWNTNEHHLYFSANEGLADLPRMLWLSNDFPMVNTITSSLQTSAYTEVAKSIVSANIVVAEPGLTVDKLRIQVFTKSPSDFGDSIWVCDNEKTIGTWSGKAEINGETELTINGTWSGRPAVINMIVDWSRISASGVLINGVPGQAPIHLRHNNIGESTADRRVKGHEETFHLAQWLDPSAKSHLLWDSFAALTANYVKGFYLAGTQAGVVYGIGIITKNSTTYGTKVDVFNNERRIVASGRVDAPNENGETIFELKPVGSTVHGKIWLDMTQMSDGVVENTNSPRFLLNPDYVEVRAIPDMLPDVKSETKPFTVRNPVRLACMGSSITWGSGYVGQSSYVGAVEDYLRHEVATTILGEQLGYTTRLPEPMQYKGAVAYLEGNDATTEFMLQGDEISLAICKERGNEHAAIVELWVNDELSQRFSTFNDEPFSEGEVKFWQADGSTRSWDLGVPFTFNHTVRRNGKVLTGGMNSGGYSGSWPDGWEYMIIRKTKESGAEHEITHWLTFKVNQAEGTVIECGFDHGETIKPMRSTVGNLGKGLGSGIESTYGDGNIAYDPANPVGLSSGLDFRYTDDRAIITAKFPTVGALNAKLVIVGSDPRVANPSSPRLYLNFVTNKMHHLMNAGIGGFKASNFLSSYASLKSHYKVSQWQPTHISMESCTNDDWGTNEYLCWTDVTMTQAQLFKVDSLLWLQSIQQNPDGSYLVSDSRIDYEEIGPFHVILNSDTTHIGDIQPGDVVTFGRWKGDNRSMSVRLVKSWDAASRRIEWGPELRLDDFGWQMDSLADIETIQVKSLKQWGANVESVIHYLKEANPNAQISIGTSGVPNMRTRRLEGYADYGKHIAKQLGVDFVDYYQVTRDWSENTAADHQVYVTADAGEISDGSAEFPLYLADGRELRNHWALRGWSVVVNGIERYLDGCYVIGGARRAWSDINAELTMSNYTWVFDQFKVIFTRDVPPAGAQIIVKKSSQYWSGDDCHPSSTGYSLFGQALTEYLRKVI